MGWGHLGMPRAQYCCEGRAKQRGAWGRLGGVGGAVCGLASRPPPALCPGLLPPCVPPCVPPWASLPSATGLSAHTCARTKLTVSPTIVTQVPLRAGRLLNIWFRSQTAHGIPRIRHATVVMSPQSIHDMLMLLGVMQGAGA